MLTLGILLGCCWTGAGGGGGGGAETGGPLTATELMILAMSSVDEERA